MLPVIMILQSMVYPMIICRYVAMEFLRTNTFELRDMPATYQGHFSAVYNISWANLNPEKRVPSLSKTTTRDWTYSYPH